MFIIRPQSVLRSTRELAIGMCTIYLGGVSTMILQVSHKISSEVVFHFVLATTFFVLSVFVDRYIHV